jgi:hypothetical protein
VPLVDGMTMAQHELSHHGQDPEILKQLQLIKEAEVHARGELLTALKAKKEGNGSLLENTIALFDSNRGNSNSHDTRNLPLLLSGGGFKHGQHIALDTKNNTPLCNLFVQMLQRMNVETDTFGSSTKTGIPGLA